MLWLLWADTPGWPNIAGASIRLAALASFQGFLANSTKTGKPDNFWRYSTPTGNAVIDSTMLCHLCRDRVL